MKQTFYTLLCCIPLFVNAAADDLSSSPTGTSWSGYVLSTLEAGRGWVEKQLGMKPLTYCLDRQARTFLKETEQILELTLGDNRARNETKSYQQLMHNPPFQALLKHLNDRSYFDWQHLRDAIAEERSSDVKKFLKACSGNLSPCLRIPAELFLEQESVKRRAATRAKTGLRFDLHNITSIGYGEATHPEIPQASASLQDLNQTIREQSSALSIASPLQRAERRMRKSIDPAFSLSYLTSAAELEKAARVYAVYFAYLFRARTVNNSIADLFKKSEFLALFNQVWDRNMHIRSVLQDQLTRASMDAGYIYEHHKINTPPLLAALVADMMLSHEQTTAAAHIPAPFKELFFTTKKPYTKYVCMFLKSLNKEQKRNVYAIKDAIPALKPEERVALINRTIGEATEAQLHLLAEIQGGERIEELFATLERARIETASPVLPRSAAIAIPGGATSSSSPMHSAVSPTSPSLSSPRLYPTLAALTTSPDPLLLTTPPLSSDSIDDLPPLTASMMPTESATEAGAGIDTPASSAPESSVSLTSSPETSGEEDGIEPTD